MKKIILIALNIILLFIIWLSDDDYLAKLKREAHQASIVLSNNSTFEPGKEIVWVIPVNEKRDMTETLELELTAPASANPDMRRFQLQIDGYIEFDDGRKLQRIFVPSIFGQKEIKNGTRVEYPFTQEYTDPSIVKSESSQIAKFADNSSLYRIGQFVNLFWEPLTIRIKIVDLSDPLIGQPLHMELRSKHSEVGLLYSLTKLTSYLKISVAVICLVLINFIYLKNSNSNTSLPPQNDTNKAHRFGLLSPKIAIAINITLLAQTLWSAFRDMTPHWVLLETLGYSALLAYSLFNIVSLLTPITHAGFLRVFRKYILGINILLVLAASAFALLSAIENSFSGMEIFITIVILLTPAITTWGLLAQSRFKVTIYGMSLW